MLLGNSSRLFIPIAVILAILVLALLAKSTKANSSTALTKTYANIEYAFTVKMPEEFSAYPPNGSAARDENGRPIGQTLVLQNRTGNRVQIAVTRDERTNTSNILTAEDMAQLAPYVDLSNAQEIHIAPNITGLTFTDSEHPSFGKATDEAWFTYRGNLYEVTADAKDRALFEAMMETWKFL